jgi:hypothetical protein
VGADRGRAAQLHHRPLAPAQVEASAEALPREPVESAVDLLGRGHLDRA